jgi:hypothetical protein
MAAMEGGTKYMGAPYRSTLIWHPAHPETGTKGTHLGRLHAPHAEKVVLGALLHDRKALGEFSDLKRETFF